MTIVDEIYHHIVYHTEFCIVHRIDEIPVLEPDHVQIRKTDHFNITLHHTDLHQDLETLGHLDLDHILKEKNKVNNIQKQLLHSNNTIANNTTQHSNNTIAKRLEVTCNAEKKTI